MDPQLVVGYNPMPAAERVAHYGRALRMRLIWLGVALVIVTGIYVWQSGSGGATWLMFPIGLAFPLLWTLIVLGSYVSARRTLARVNAAQGNVALRVAPWGMEVDGRQIPWSDVANVGTSRRLLAASPMLAVKDRQGQTATVGFSYLDAMPGTIDSAVRVYSHARFWLDTAGLGN